MFYGHKKVLQKNGYLNTSSGFSFQLVKTLGCYSGMKIIMLLLSCQYFIGGQVPYSKWGNRETWGIAWCNHGNLPTGQPPKFQLGLQKTILHVTSNWKENSYLGMLGKYFSSILLTSCMGSLHKNTHKKCIYYYLVEKMFTLATLQSPTQNRCMVLVL